MNTKKISIKDVASSTLSNADGVKLQTAIDKYCLMETPLLFPFMV